MKKKKKKARCQPLLGDKINKNKIIKTSFLPCKACEHTGLSPTVEKKRNCYS